MRGNIFFLFAILILSSFASAAFLSGYDTRYPINIGAVHGPVSTNNTFFVPTFNTAGWTCATDNNKLALGYNNGSNVTDLNFHITAGNCGGDMNATFRPTFNLAANTAFSSTDSNGYYWYTTTSTVANPNRDFNGVYAFGDDFEYAVGDLNAIGNPYWGAVSGGSWRIQADTVKNGTTALEAIDMAISGVNVKSIVVRDSNVFTIWMDANTTNSTSDNVFRIRDSSNNIIAAMAIEGANVKYGNNVGTPINFSTPLAYVADTWIRVEIVYNAGDANAIFRVYDSSNILVRDTNAVAANPGIVNNIILIADGPFKHRFDDAITYLSIVPTPQFVVAGSNPSLVYSNFSTYLGINYTNSLRYDINYTCTTGQSGLISLRVNGTQVQTNNPTCDSTSKLLNNSYTHSVDGNTTVDVRYAIDSDVNILSPIQMTWDLNAPTINRFDTNSLIGFGIAGQLHYTLRCSDTVSPLLTYQLTNNDVNQYAASDLNNATVYDMNNTLNNGVNTVRFRCRDLGGNLTTDTNTFSGSSTTFYFVYADTGVSLTNGLTEYPAADVNTLKAYSYNLKQYKDMFATGDVNLSYSGVGDDSIQFAITYTDPTFPTVLLNFDIDTLDTNSVPMCFSKLFPFRQQIFYSSTERSLIFQNGNTGCYAGTAKTSAAYQDLFQLIAYTIPMTYNLFLFEDSNRTLLSLVDGSIALPHNIYLLIINAEEKEPVLVTTDTLTASRYCQVTTDCNVLAVEYQSPQDNSSVTISILNGTTVLTSTTATAPDANRVSFTWNFTNADVNTDFLTLKAEIIRADGTTQIIRQNFTLRGLQGFLDPTIALILSSGLFLFGITLLASRFVLGWFGIIIVIASLALLSTAPSVGYIVLMQTVFFIVGIFFFLSWKNETVKGI